MIHMIKEEQLPAEMLLGLLHLRDNDQIANGILSLELQTYVRCFTEGSHIGKKNNNKNEIFIVSCSCLKII